MTFHVDDKPEVKVENQVDNMSEDSAGQPDNGSDNGPDSGKKAELLPVNEDQVVDYLISHPEFFHAHYLLLNDLEIPHDSGTAVSLVERQVAVLREKNQNFETKLREMVDAVHDNQRLHLSLHRLAVNLFAADGLDDLMGIVDDELRHKLGTDFVYFRLSTEDEIEREDSEFSHTYVEREDEVLLSFAPLIQKKRIQCGRFTQDQMLQLFMEDAEDVRSAAVIPIEDAGIYGLIALGSVDEKRYHPGMGTDFLSSLSDLLSAAMKAQLKS